MSAAETAAPARDPVTIATLTPLRCWVAWQTENRPGGKPTKVPYAPDGRKAKANAPRTWGTRAAAEAMASVLPKPYGAGGVGLELAETNDGRNVGGIDLDSCRNPETGSIDGWATDIIKCLGTYTEVSPSETGAKCFFTYERSYLPKLRAAMDGAAWSKMFKRGGDGDHPPAIELHLGNRYFAVTDRKLPDSPDEFAHVSTDTLLEIVRTTGPAFGGHAAANDDDALEADAPPARKRKRAANDGFDAGGSYDRSRSAAAFRKGKELRRNGATFEEMAAALAADPETAEWTREKGTANNQRELLRIWERTEPKGPLIRVVAGELHATTTQAESALIASGLPLYQRGDAIVRPIEREVPASHGRTTLSAGLGELTAPALVDVMCATAEWERFDSRAGDWVRINPPAQVAQVLLSRVGFWRFPAIKGVITVPTLRPDGSLLIDAGYDAATRLYHVADPSVRLHPAVHAPTRAAAEGALRALSDLLAEFPFSGSNPEVARAVALSALITPVVRGAMPVAPLHAFTAPAAGTGKSYLIDTASLISTGRPCPVTSAAPDEHETEKRLVGMLLTANPLGCIDNVNDELGGDLLCQAIERPLIALRRLGASDIIEIENAVSLYANGNNLRVRGDMVRRTLVARLDAQVERPELRTFRGDPVATVAANRGRYVSAALVIARAYLAAGSPDKLPPIASFTPWSDIVRSALVWLGCADPAASMADARADDPELGELTEVLSAWAAALGTGRGYTVRDIAGATEERAETVMGEPTDFRHPDLRDALARVAGERGEVNTRRLGKWLASREGRIVGGLRLAKLPGLAHGGIPRWSVDRV
jgi:hypothetical protein